ncbi:protein of unknown function [uncultured Sphingopyxis sp.]|uniref:Uncharacterized protein n=1 Tax=uncultured Sphingopyxis sp. TaxID=310581 RepID=A0A1Y5PUW9_9SPHN|nr:hypothetical protein [uncultured Sphingopyxis sp.]SBV32476.1 protein of unknown function [uncultured Sphingopyxis sp.]
MECRAAGRPGHKKGKTGPKPFKLSDGGGLRANSGYPEAQEQRAALFCTGSKAGSLYDDKAFGTPNGLALAYVAGLTPTLRADGKLEVKGCKAAIFCPTKVWARARRVSRRSASYCCISRPKTMRCSSRLPLKYGASREGRGLAGKEQAVVAMMAALCQSASRSVSKRGTRIALIGQYIWTSDYSWVTRVHGFRPDEQGKQRAEEANRELVEKAAARAHEFERKIGVASQDGDHEDRDYRVSNSNPSIRVRSIKQSSLRGLLRSLFGE